MISAGFFINFEKSIWEPTRRLTWLGFDWDVEKLTLSIPDRKIHNFKLEICSLLSKLNNISARLLARISGKIISFMPSFGNLCRIMSRHLLMIIATSDYWDQKIVLSEEAIGELEFWLFNIHCLTPRRFLVHRKLPDKIVYTDASNYACAGYLVESNPKIVHKMWSESEASKSSTQRVTRSFNYYRVFERRFL